MIFLITEGNNFHRIHVILFNTKNLIIYSKTVGSSFEFLLPVVLTATSFLLGETLIKVDDNQFESCVMFTALIANPSTGKSTGMNLVKDALLDIEKYEKVSLTDSNLINGFF